MSYGQGKTLRKVINLQTGAHIPCCWEDCWRDGVELHKFVVREGVNTITYVFCSERHRRYFMNSHISLGNLPNGYRNSY